MFDMRFGRQRIDAVRPAQKSILEEVYALAKTTFHRKEVFPSEVERVSELLCEPSLFLRTLNSRLLRSDQYLGCLSCQAYKQTIFFCESLEGSCFLQ